MALGRWTNAAVIALNRIGLYVIWNSDSCKRHDITTVGPSRIAHDEGCNRGGVVPPQVIFEKLLLCRPRKLSHFMSFDSTVEFRDTADKGLLEIDCIARWALGLVGD